jgi:hypothetical protein
MKTFLIQTVDNEVAHDFSFSLIEAIKYNNWYYHTNIYRYILTNNTNVSISNCVPIGSIEFVMNYLNTYYPSNQYKPLNIPPELMKDEYLKRSCTIETAENIHQYKEPLFIKDVDKLKGFCEIVNNKQDMPASGNYLVSEIIDIKSEWRAFVYNNELVGLQNYSGDFKLFPDVQIIQNMIKDFNYPYAHTIDVGINDKGTFVIECHDFFSCGLYGFAEHKILPKMFISTWKRLIEEF